MPWHSGPWSLMLRGDEFADIAYDGRVVLRSVRAVVRDADWNTADLVVDRVRVASAAALAVPGVASLAYFEEWGLRGIRSSDGDDLPVAAAVRELAALSGGERLTGESPDGLVWALGARRRGTVTVLAANLDRAARTITLDLAGRRSDLTLPPGSFRRADIPSTTRA